MREHDHHEGTQRELVSRSVQPIDERHRGRRLARESHASFLNRPFSSAVTRWPSASIGPGCDGPQSYENTMDGSVPETSLCPDAGVSRQRQRARPLRPRSAARDPAAATPGATRASSSRTSDGDDGHIARTATVFLTGRECPWRCAMCDLWQYTTADDTPRGAIPAQVAAAREELRAASEDVTLLKLYNAGSFFDPRAVPEPDYDDVAAALAGLARVVVESHPVARRPPRRPLSGRVAASATRHGDRPARGRDGPGDRAPARPSIV